MITNILTNVTPSDYEGASHKETVTTITREQIENAASFNLCDFQCPYVEPAFSENGAIVDGYKNDVTQFLQQLSLTSDTVVFKLFKCENGVDVEKATLNNNDYGTYYVQSYFPDQLKFGFEVDWNKVFNLLGTGTYFITTDRVLIGVSSSLRSWQYAVQEFSEIGAGDTILISETKEGIIQGGIDYNGFAWVNRLRIYGTFGDIDPKLDKIHYANQGRSQRQVSASSLTSYTLETELVPYEVIAPFLYDTLLQNNIDIMVYTLFSFLPKFKFYEVVADEIEKPSFYERNTNGKFTFIFSDREKTPVITNLK